jgi:uncharacterized Zn finger protein
MKELKFLVQGSAPDPYQVIFRKDGNNFTALCTCPAGQNGLYCKHRFNIIGGSSQNIKSGNSELVKVVVEMVKGTDVEQAILELKEAEQKFEILKKEVSNLKKQLARKMLD